MKGCIEGFMEIYGDIWGYTEIYISIYTEIKGGYREK